MTTNPRAMDIARDVLNNVTPAVRKCVRVGAFCPCLPCLAPLDLVAGWFVLTSLVYRNILERGEEFQHVFGKLCKKHPKQVCAPPECKAFSFPSPPLSSPPLLSPNPSPPLPPTPPLPLVPSPVAVGVGVWVCGCVCVGGG